MSNLKIAAVVVAAVAMITAYAAVAAAPPPAPMSMPGITPEPTTAPVIPPPVTPEWFAQPTSAPLVMPAATVTPTAVAATPAPQPTPQPAPALVPAIHTDCVRWLQDAFSQSRDEILADATPMSLPLNERGDRGSSALDRIFYNAFAADREQLGPRCSHNQWPATVSYEPAPACQRWQVHIEGHGVVEPDRVTGLTDYVHLVVQFSQYPGTADGACWHWYPGDTDWHVITGDLPTHDYRYLPGAFAAVRNAADLAGLVYRLGLITPTWTADEEPANEYRRVLTDSAAVCALERVAAWGLSGRDVLHAVMLEGQWYATGRDLVRMYVEYCGMADVADETISPELTQRLRGCLAQLGMDWWAGRLPYMHWSGQEASVDAFCADAKS